MCLFGSDGRGIVSFSMKTSDLDYDLPKDLIAQHPCERRDESRLLVLDRTNGSFRLDRFRNLAGYLRGGDCVVLNDTRVIRARLKATKATGGHVEIFLLREIRAGSWTALVRPSSRVAPGTRVSVGEAVEAVIGEVLPNAQREVVFDTPDVLQVLERVGEIPLPPYIHRKQPEDSDLTRYQTVYACMPGAVAAPTAGLHFTEQVFDSLMDKGIGHTYLTLHVGYGTFKPITADTIEEHTVDAEEFCFPPESAELLNRTRRSGGRVVAVGTTASRVLETQYQGDLYQPGEGLTGLYIYPPYRFRGVDALLTNFHLPRSSLLALVFAFAGKDLVMNAYRRAIEERFRFYSYGDAMLIL